MFIRLRKGTLQRLLMQVLEVVQMCYNNIELMAIRHLVRNIVM